MKKYYGVIYILINNINGKCYVGQTKNYFSRIDNYAKGDCERQPKLHRAICKYGWSNFSNEIIERCSEGPYSLNIMEIKWIRHLCTVEFGYNCTYGGLGGKRSEEYKLRMSKMRSGENHTMFGKKRAADFCEKMRERHTGNGNPMFGKTGSLHHLFQKERTPEEKERISNSLRKTYEENPEILLNLSNKMKKRFEDEKNREQSRMLKKRFMKPIRCITPGKEQEFESTRAACRFYGIAQPIMKNHLKRKRNSKSIYGLTFEYIIPLSTDAQS